MRDVEDDVQISIKPVYSNTVRSLDSIAGSKRWCLRFVVVPSISRRGQSFLSVHDQTSGVEASKQRASASVKSIVGPDLVARDMK